MNSPLIVAMDFSHQSEAVALAKSLSPETCRLKVGKELFTREGPDVVRELQDLGFDIFLDLKFHDIPNTVAKALTAAAELGVWMVNVHASGGSEMMAAAREAVDSCERPPLLIAVTVLTSMSQQQLSGMGVSNALDEQVTLLASMASRCGLDGVVCSAREASMLKSSLGDKFITVTPGIRPAGASLGDQHRVMTPAKAIQSGSDYLVVGRPITQAENPAQAVTDILDGLKNV